MCARVYCRDREEGAGGCGSGDAIYQSIYVNYRLCIVGLGPRRAIDTAMLHVLGYAKRPEVLEDWREGAELTTDYCRDQVD